MPKLQEKVLRSARVLVTLPPPEPAPDPATWSAIQPPGSSSSAQTDIESLGYSSTGGDFSTVLSKPKWGNLNSIDEQAFFQALLAEAAYCNNQGALDALATAIGADSITRVIQTLPCPSGILVTYKDVTILAIAGTTDDSQQNVYQRSGQAYPIALARNTLGYSFGSDVGPVATAYQNSMYIGVWYLPFIQMGMPWVHWARNFLNDGSFGSTRKLVLVGHSLGAAVVNLLAHFGSFEHIATGRHASINAFAASGGPSSPWQNKEPNWNAIETGFCFGCPRVMYWGSDSKLSSVGGVVAKDAGFKLGFPWSTIARRINVFQHPYDPVTTVPAPFRGSPWYYTAAGATVGDATLYNGFSRILKFAAVDTRTLVNPNGNVDLYPKDVAQLKNWVLANHPVNSYVGLLASNLMQTPSWNEAWATVYTQVLALSSNEKVNTFT